MLFLITIKIVNQQSAADQSPITPQVQRRKSIQGAFGGIFD